MLPAAQGLARLDAAACLCSAIRADTIPGIVNFYVPLGLGLVLNFCGKDVPPIGLSCPLTA